MATELDLGQMTVEQKLQLVDELWLSMAPELELLDVRQADRELLDQRGRLSLRIRARRLRSKNSSGA